MFKKIISMAFAVMLAFSTVSFAEGKEPSKLSFNSKTDWSMTQGENSWYYQYTIDGTYSGYKNMTWATKGSNTTFHGANDTGAFVDNFYVKENSMHIGGANLKPARVWVAPYPGVVRVASVGNIRKLSTSTLGEIVYANIVKTDKNQKNEKVLWSCGIKQGDSIGNDNIYSFDVEVDKGERIYFELSSAGAANGGAYWETTIDYRQAAYFEKDAKQVSSIDELKANDSLKCTFYDLKSIDENAKLYMAVYDENGRMRAMSNVSKIDIESWSERKADITIVMPDSENGFSGWNVKLFGITDISGRYWPIKISDAICLD